VSLNFFFHAGRTKVPCRSIPLRVSTCPNSKRLAKAIAFDKWGGREFMIRPAGRQAELFNEQIFSELRAHAQVPDDFVNSGWSLENLSHGGGKGGSLMARGRDSYIVKELSKGDHECLLRIATSYGQHVQGKETLLCPIYLHFRDKATDRCFFAMRNSIGSGPFKACLDLKGCADDKFLEKDGKKIEAVHKRIWNVGMWCGQSGWSTARKVYHAGKVEARSIQLAMTKEQRDWFVGALRRDTEWLASNNLMDYSLLVAMMSCVAVLWNALLRVGAATEARRQNEKLRRRAPPGFIARIPTVPYDPELFGTEDGRRYHGECCICLGEFGAEDEIKVPHCGHAFHKDCLRRWLRKERTCALCRRDVTQASEAGAEDVGFGADVAVPGAGGPEEATPGTAPAAHSGVARAQPVVLGRLSSAHEAAASHPTHDAEVLPTHERSA